MRVGDQGPWDPVMVLKSAPEPEQGRSITQASTFWNGPSSVVGHFSKCGLQPTCLGQLRRCPGRTSFLLSQKQELPVPQGLASLKDP